jgi:hypothetical protein
MLWRLASGGPLCRRDRGVLAHEAHGLPAPGALVRRVRGRLSSPGRGEADPPSDGRPSHPPVGVRRRRPEDAHVYRATAVAAPYAREGAHGGRFSTVCDAGGARPVAACEGSVKVRAGRRMRRGAVPRGHRGSEWQRPLHDAACGGSVG